MSKDPPVLDRKVVEEGGLVFRQGDEGSCAYIVQEGSIEILCNYGLPDEKVLGVINKGGIFGEMALIDDQQRMATARALEPTTLIIANRMMFREKLLKADPFIRGLLKIMVANIRQLADVDKKKFSRGVVQTTDHSSDL